MAIDRSKLTIEANGYVAKGNFRKAVALYERIVAADPDDDRAMLRLADLQVRAGQPDAAIRTFHELADAYVVRGFFLKAVSVYKQVLRVRPEAIDVRARLGDLYYQLGLLSDALVFYNEVAQHALDGGRIADYIDMLQRILDIDPSNVGYRIKLAEQLAKQGSDSLGAHHLRVALDTLDDAGRFDEYIRVAERYLHIVPDDVDVSERLVRIFVDSGRARRGLGRIQAVFRAGLYRTSSIDLLAETLRAAGENDRAPVVLREVAQLAHTEGRVAESEQAWRRVLDFDPSDAVARRALGDAPVVDPTHEEVLTFEVIEPDPVDDVDHSAEIEKILSETDIYLKYSLHQKAIDHLDRALALDPKCEGALERRRQAWLATDQRTEAALDTARLALALRVSQPARAVSLAAEARGLDASNPDVQALLGQLDADASPPPAFSPTPPADRAAPLAPAPPAGAESPAVDLPFAPLPPPIEFELEAPDAYSVEPPRGVVDEFDALFAGVDAESVEDAGTCALDEELSLIRAIDSVFDTAGISQGLPGVSFGGNQVHGAQVPEELALLLDDVDEQARAGNASLAQATLLELMGEFPEHAEVILGRMDRLSELSADPPSDSLAFLEEPAAGPNEGDAVVFELDEEASDEEALVFELDKDASDEEALVFELDEDASDEEALVFDLDEDASDEAALVFDLHEGEAEDEAAKENEPTDEQDGEDGIVFDVDEDGEEDAEIAFVLDEDEAPPAPISVSDQADDLLASGDQASDETDAPRGLLADLEEPEPVFEGRDQRMHGDGRVPVLSGDHPSIPIDDLPDPETFPREHPTMMSIRPLTPELEPSTTGGPFTPEPSLDRHFEQVEDPFAPVPAQAPPSDTPTLDAPVGVPSTGNGLAFEPLLIALEEEPAGTVAQAVQIRAGGSAMEAIALLQAEFYGPWAVAAVFETACANLELGMFLEALTFLESLEHAPGVGSAELATLKYLQGICSEALGESERAASLFADLLDTEHAGAYPDLTVRVRRLQARV